MSIVFQKLKFFSGNWGLATLKVCFFFNSDWSGETTENFLFFSLTFFKNFGKIKSCGWFDKSEITRITKNFRYCYFLLFVNNCLPLSVCIGSRFFVFVKLSLQVFFIIFLEYFHHMNIFSSWLHIVVLVKYLHVLQTLDGLHIHWGKIHHFTYFFSLFSPEISNFFSDSVVCGQHLYVRLFHRAYRAQFCLILFSNWFLYYNWKKRNKAKILSIPLYLWNCFFFIKMN